MKDQSLLKAIKGSSAGEAPIFIKNKKDVRINQKLIVREKENFEENLFLNMGRI